MECVALLAQCVGGPPDNTCDFLLAIDCDLARSIFVCDESIRHSFRKRAVIIITPTIAYARSFIRYRPLCVAHAT